MHVRYRMQEVTPILGPGIMVLEHVPVTAFLADLIDRKGQFPVNWDKSTPVTRTDLLIDIGKTQIDICGTMMEIFVVRQYLLGLQRRLVKGAVMWAPSFVGISTELLRRQALEETICDADPEIRLSELKDQETLKLVEILELALVMKGSIHTAL